MIYYFYEPRKNPEALTVIPSEASQEGKESPEQVPTLEEIKAVIHKAIEGRAFREVRLLSDEKRGVYCYEIEVTLEDGGTRTYNYQQTTDPAHKDRSLPLSAQSPASIHYVEFDSTGFPVGGDHIADYWDGKWEYPVEKPVEGVIIPPEESHPRLGE